MEEHTRTLLCGDLFTQGGAQHPAITETDILGPSEAFRQKPEDGLLFAYEERASDARETGLTPTHNTGVYARQRMAGGRCEAATSSG
jgi:hypothetical protein